MDHDKSNHHQNLSINSLNSIVEPLTPPDLSGSEHQSFSNLSFTAGSSTFTSNQPSTASSTPVSSLNTILGGNTYRSRFKSLPLVNELDYKFNQLSINTLQGLSQQTGPNSGHPSLGSFNSNSTGSIPQISLQQYHLNQQSGANLQTSPPRPLPEKHRSHPNISTHQHHSSLSSLSLPVQQAKPATSINYKNFDELNLIPMEKLDVLKLAVDQYGCRFLQRKLEVDNSLKDVIFNKIFHNLIDLIVDPFGNYLIQKLIDYLSTYQKDLLIEKVHSFLFLISINQYGTRSLQKIIEKISNSYQMDLIISGLQISDTNNEIEDNNIVKLIKDLNGNHVIQKCIFKFPPEKFQFIIDSICSNNNIVKISTHKHGCCVLQKLLNNANYNQILSISKVLLIYLNDLINDQFGNYIIQFLFELSFLKTSDTLDFMIDDFFEGIYKSLVRLSCLKFSSNVIEKFIKTLKFKQNYIYLTEIIKLININFDKLIRDKFGNYVIQTLIDQFHGSNELDIAMSMLIANIKKYLPVIKSAPYARKIQLKVQQYETNYEPNGSTGSSVLSALPTSKVNSGNYPRQTNFDEQLKNYENIIEYSNYNYANQYPENQFAYNTAQYINQTNRSSQLLNDGAYR